MMKECTRSWRLVLAALALGVMGLASIAVSQDDIDVCSYPCEQICTGDICECLCAENPEGCMASNGETAIGGYCEGDPGLPEGGEKIILARPWFAFYKLPCSAFTSDFEFTDCLTAGQHIDVGDITVSYDAGSREMVLGLDTDDLWDLAEAHAYLGMTEPLKTPGRWGEPHEFACPDGAGAVRCEDMVDLDYFVMSVPECSDGFIYIALQSEVYELPVA